MNLPTGTSNPSSPVSGSSYFNTTAAELRIYDGSQWGGLVVSKGTASNPASSASDLNATGALAQYYFSPDGGTAFQQWAAGGISNLGTIPSGGPSWVGNHGSIVIIEQGKVNTTSSKTMTQTNFLKFIAESISRTSNNATPYIYWSVFDNGTLWGVWRIQWRNATYSSWYSNHNYTEGSNTAPSGTPYSDVWKTGSGTHSTASGSYTVTNNNNLNRAVLPDQNYQGQSGSRGIHYKRLSSGEHYPWRTTSGGSYYMNTNGYFYPSGSYSMGTDTRFDHYIYFSDS